MCVMCVCVSLSLCICLEGDQWPFRVVFVNGSIVGQVPGSEIW